MTIVLDDDPLAITLGGVTRYFRNMDFHRTDGPAVIARNGYEEWWVNGERKLLVMVAPNKIFIQGDFDKSSYPSLREIGPETYYIDSDDATLLRLRHNVYESPI